MTILIVDDKPNLARVTAFALRTLGCKAFTAGTTDVATQLLRAEKIDAIFLDLNLNGEDGFLFLSQLVNYPNPVPVILFTAHPKEDVAAEALRRGAFDCLIKPFTMEELRQQLARIEQYKQSIEN